MNAALTTALIGLFTGIGGWCFTNFCFHPWTEVQALRRKSRFEIIYWLTSTRETSAAACDAFRKVAFELLALHETCPHWFRKLLMFKSYDLTQAAEGMIGLSHVREGDFVYRAICRHKLEKGLLLQLEFSEEDFARIYNRWVEKNDSGCDNYHAGDPVEELFVRDQLVSISTPIRPLG